MSGLEALEAHLSGLLSAIEPKSRSALARDIAKRLRASQAARIAAQQNPDGTPFAPRKPRLRKGKGVLRKTMFSKLRTAKYFKAQSSADSASLTFTNANQRLASVHQFGLRDRVERRGPSAKYPARQLLGLTKDEVVLIGAMVLDHLSKG